MNVRRSPIHWLRLDSFLAQMIMPKRMHELRLYGLKPWDDNIMQEVDHFSTNECAFTVAVELWWIVYHPHVDCPPACMGAEGVKCVLLPGDRDRFVTMMAPLGPLDDEGFLKVIEGNCKFKRISMRPAIMEMFEGVFHVWTGPATGVREFRVSPFVTGQTFLNIMVPLLGPRVHREWFLLVNDEEMNANLSLLMQGLHAGCDDDNGALVLRRRIPY
jgi:hypothetical protein